MRQRMSPAERHLFDNTDLRPNISLWAKKPLRFGAAYRRQLHKSRNISLYLHANVTEIQLNGAGNRVEECMAMTLSGTTLHLKARHFVLACHDFKDRSTAVGVACSTPSGHWESGRHGGAVLHGSSARGIWQSQLSSPQKLPLLLGMPLMDGVAQVGMQFSEAVQRRERLLNHYLSLERRWSEQTAQAYQSFVHSMKILLRKGYAGKRFSFSGANLAQVPELIYLLAPRELMPHVLYSTARRLKQRLSKGVTELIVVNYAKDVESAEPGLSQRQT